MQNFATKLPEVSSGLRTRVFGILSTSSERFTPSWYFDLFIITLVLLNTLAVMLESEPAMVEAYGSLLAGFEWFSVTVFGIEYLLRLWTANELPRYRKPLIGNIRWALTPMAVIDLLAFAPSLLMLVGVDLRFLRVIRVLRLFRLFKMARYIRALLLIEKVFREKREELIVSFFLTIFMLLVTSTLMYHVENAAQPEAFSSIRRTMLWGVEATLTTVGYGDIYPVTGFGKFLGALISLLGIGLFALPTGILASGFSDELSGKQAEETCPHCEKSYSKGF